MTDTKDIDNLIEKLEKLAAYADPEGLLERAIQTLRSQETTLDLYRSEVKTNIAAMKASGAKIRYQQEELINIKAAINNIYQSGGACTDSDDCPLCQLEKLIKAKLLTDTTEIDMFSSYMKDPVVDFDAIVLKLHQDIKFQREELTRTRELE